MAGTEAPRRAAAPSKAAVHILLLETLPHLANLPPTSKIHKSTCEDAGAPSEAGLYRNTDAQSVTNYLNFPS
ncbi:hypothetical protein Emag_007699 [Eimeria magna]